MTSIAEGNKMAIPTTSSIYLDGNEVLLTAYNIEGNNYFMLRDIPIICFFNKFSSNALYIKVLQH